MQKPLKQDQEFEGRCTEMSVTYVKSLNQSAVNAHEDEIQIFVGLGSPEPRRVVPWLR